MAIGLGSMVSEAIANLERLVWTEVGMEWIVEKMRGEKVDILAVNHSLKKFAVKGVKAKG